MELNMKAISMKWNKVFLLNFFFILLLFSCKKEDDHKVCLSIIATDFVTKERLKNVPIGIAYSSIGSWANKLHFVDTLYTDNKGEALYTFNPKLGKIYKMAPIWNNEYAFFEAITIPTAQSTPTVKIELKRFVVCKLVLTSSNLYDSVAFSHFSEGRPGFEHGYQGSFKDTVVYYNQVTPDVNFEISYSLYEENVLKKEVGNVIFVPLQQDTVVYYVNE